MREKFLREAQYSRGLPFVFAVYKLTYFINHSCHTYHVPQAMKFDSYMYLSTGVTNLTG